MEKEEKAVALKYEVGFEAPIISAKGNGFKAKKILEIAKKENIPIKEDVSVINLLENSEEGNFVPEAAYKVLAIIFSFILEDKNG